MHATTANAAHEITASSNDHPMTAKSLGAASWPSCFRTPGECLSSWKEIASYLKRTVRTVQRWESHEGLPIHRHPHRTANSVYAYRSELDDWWKREIRSREVVPIQSPCAPTSVKAFPVGRTLTEAGSYHRRLGKVRP